MLGDVAQILGAIGSVWLFVGVIAALMLLYRTTRA
jgi:hypothetical protein